MIKKPGFRPFSASTFTSTFLILLLTATVRAETLGTTKIYYSGGKRSQTAGIEERDLGGEYSFYKYGISVKAQPKEGFQYKAGFQYYKKKFDTARNELDNRTNIYDASISVPLYSGDNGGLSLTSDYRLRSKRYKNSPSLEYDQNSLKGGFGITTKENYSLKVSGGIKDYDYLKESSSNQLKSFFKIAPSMKLLKKNLTLSGYYKRDWVDQSDKKKDYTEDSISIRTALKLDTPILYKLSGHFGYGRNDTRDSGEDREDNLRFEYRLWDIKSYYRLGRTIDTRLSYGQKHRKYFTSINSYDDWYIKDQTSINLFKKEPFKLDMLAGVEHRETKFSENDKLSYNKNAVSGGFNISKRSNYSVKPIFKFTDYKYPPLSPNDQKEYKIDLSLMKYIGSTDKAFKASYWYKWKDYKYKADVEQWALSLSFKLEF